MPNNYDAVVEANKKNLTKAQIAALAKAAQEYSLYNSDIESAINTFHGQAVVSGYTDAEWDAYVKQLDSLGLADYITYQQHCYDADF